MSKLLCKYADVIKKHILKDDLKTNLEAMLKEAGANSEEIQTITKSFKTGYKKAINETKGKALERFLEKADPRIKTNSKKFQQLFNDILDNKLSENALNREVMSSFKLETLKPEKIKAIQDITKRIKELPEGLEKEKEKMFLQAELTDLSDPNVISKLTSYQNLNLLFSITGRSRDVISTAYNKFIYGMEKFLADYTLNLAKGIKTQKSAKLAMSEYFNLFNEGYKDAYKRGMMSIGEGKFAKIRPIFNETGKFASYNKPQKILLGVMQGMDYAVAGMTKVENLVEDLSRRGIDLPDFKTVKEANEWFTKAENGQIKGLSSDDFLEARAYAETQADALTFKDNTLISKALSSLEKATPVNKFFIKYLKTMGNILNQGIERSPVWGTAKAGFKFFNDLDKVKKGYISKDLVERELVRKLYSSLGIGAIGAPAIGAWLASQGLLTTERPKDISFKGDEGKSSLYFKAGDLYFDTSWLSIFTPTIASGVMLQEGKPLDKVLTSVLSLPLQTFGDLPFLRPLRNLMGAKDYGEGAEKVLAYGVETLGTLLPFKTLVGQLVRTVDPSVRETYDKNLIQQAVNRQLAPYFGGKTFQFSEGKIKDLPKKYGVEGEELKKTTSSLESNKGITPILRGLNNLLNPFFVQEIKRNPLLDETRRLQEITNKDVFNKIDKKMSIKDQSGQTQKIELTGKQVSELQKYEGEKASRLLNALISNDFYNELDDETKAKVMEEVISQVHTAGKMKILGHRVPRKSLRAGSNNGLANAVLSEDDNILARGLQISLMKILRPKRQRGNREFDYNYELE